MKRVQLLSPWIGDGTFGTNPYRPAFRDDYTYVRYADVTGQPGDQLPPSPNVLTLEALVDDAVFDVLEADTDYLILWSEVA